MDKALWDFYLLQLVHSAKGDLLYVITIQLSVKSCYILTVPLQRLLIPGDYMAKTVLVVSAGTDECTMTSMYMQVWEITSILHCGSIPEMMIVIEQAIIWW